MHSIAASNCYWLKSSTSTNSSERESNGTHVVQLCVLLDAEKLDVTGNALTHDGGRARVKGHDLQVAVVTRQALEGLDHRQTVVNDQHACKTKGHTHKTEICLLTIFLIKKYPEDSKRKTLGETTSYETLKVNVVHRRWTQRYK